MEGENTFLQEKLAEQGQYMYKDFMTRTIDILERMKSRFGEEVYSVVDEMVGDRTSRQWRELAQREEGHTAQDLVRVLWEPLSTQGFEFTVENRDDGIQIYCTRCPLYELAKEINGQEWMYYINCGTDPYIVQGFNPMIHFKRTKTLMQGHDCCDHFYGYP